MKKILTKTNIRLLVVALCAILFCGLFAFSNFVTRKVQTAHAEDNLPVLSRDWDDKVDDVISDYVSENGGNGWTVVSLFFTTQLYHSIEAFQIGPVDVSEAQDNSVVAYLKDEGSFKFECEIYANGQSIYAPENCANLFTGSGTVYFGCFDTSNVTNMRSMFDHYQGTFIDISSFDTSNVTDMAYMFEDSPNLEQVIFGSIDTSKVETMEKMFCDCQKLKSIDFSKFNTSNVTNMNGMFIDCVSLTKLDLSSFDTNNVTDMTEMFAMVFGENHNISQEYLCAYLGIEYTPGITYTQMMEEYTGEAWTYGEEMARQTAVDTLQGEIDDGLSVTALKALDIRNFVIGENVTTDRMFAGLNALETMYSPVTCAKTISLPFAMYQENTENQFKSISNSTNTFVLLNTANSTAPTPNTGFVDEQLLPALAVGLVSILAVAFVANKNKKFAK